MPQMIFDVPDAKFAEFKAAYLAMYPNRSGQTDNQWIKEVILSNIKGVYMNGKKKLHPGPTIDDDIVTL
jgi:hypothetical protein